MFKADLKLISVFAGLFAILCCVGVIQTVSANEAGTVSNTIIHTPEITLSESIVEQSGGRSAMSMENEEHEYISPVFDASFEFTGLGLTWSSTSTNVESVGDEDESAGVFIPDNVLTVAATNEAEADVTFYIKVGDNDWEVLPMMGHEGKDKDEVFASQPMFTKGSTVQYKITGKHIEQVRNVRIIYFDASVAPEPSLLKAFTSAKPASANADGIITREEWGANESYRTWQPEYIQPQAFVVHHTAGSDGGDDPAATIRGMYYWHSIVLGWGDIGYNYIIDQQGRVYEGRAGGDGVIGAHTYNSGNQRNYNHYTVGIALMGCFETTEGACNPTHSYPEATKNSLAELIAMKADLFNIDPRGTTTLFGETQKTIIGHRDVDTTYCPGNQVHDTLRDIRQLAEAKLTAYKSQSAPLQAEIVEAMPSANYNAGDTPSITVQYKNTGSTSWLPENTNLQIYMDGKQNKQNVPVPNAVAPGETVSITFDWQRMPHVHGDRKIVTRLLYNSEQINDSKHKTIVSITNTRRAEVSVEHMPFAILYGWKPTAAYTFKNVGEATWSADTRIVYNKHTAGKLGVAVAPGESITKYIMLNPNGIMRRGGFRGISVRLIDGNIKIYRSQLTSFVRVD